MKNASTTVPSLLSNVTRQGAVVFLSRGAALFLGIAATIFLSRLLGPAGFGKFRLGSVVVQVLATFCLFGLPQALQRYLPILEARGQTANIGILLIRSSRAVIAIALVLSLVLLVGAPALADHYFHSAEMTNVLRIFCFQLPIFALFRFSAAAVTAAKRFDVASKVTNILSPAVFLFLLAVVAWIHPRLYGTIAARALAQLAAVVCLALFLVQRYPNLPRGKVDFGDTFRSCLLLSIPLFFVGFGYQLLNQMDTLMLGHFVSEREVGIYSVALKAAAFVLLGSEILLPIVAPLFSQFCETGDRESTEALFATVTKWLCYSGLLIFACIVIFRVELLHVFGKGFTAGSTVLLILAIGQLATATTGPTGILLIMRGRQRWEVANIISMLAFNFLLNLFLIPKMGKTGAAIATFLSITAINAIKVFQVYMLFRLQAYGLKYLKGIFAIGAAGLIGYAFRGWLFEFGLSPYTIMPVGGIVFLIAIVAGFWLVGLDEEDKVALVALRRRKSGAAVLPSEKGLERRFS